MIDGKGVCREAEDEGELDMQGTTGFDPKIQALDSSASYRWDQAGRAPSACVAACAIGRWPARLSEGLVGKDPWPCSGPAGFGFPTSTSR